MTTDINMKDLMEAAPSASKHTTEVLSPSQHWQSAFITQDSQDAYDESSEDDIQMIPPKNRKATNSYIRRL